MGGCFLALPLSHTFPLLVSSSRCLYHRRKQGPPRTGASSHACPLRLFCRGPEPSSASRKESFASGDLARTQTLHSPIPQSDVAPGTRRPDQAIRHHGRNRTRTDRSLVSSEPQASDLLVVSRYHRRVGRCARSSLSP